MTESWGQIRDDIKAAVGANNYAAWIEPLALESIQGNVVTFKAPTRFIGNWVSQNYGDVILRHITEAGVSVDRLDMCVESAPEMQSKPALSVQAAKKEAVQIEAPELEGASLDPRFTFDAFVVGGPNQLAFAAAKRVASGETHGFSPLFLHGGVGLGKTHLMQAIAWELKEKSPEKRVLFLSAEQFMYRFVQALRSKDTLTFKHLFRSVDVLLVDDVQFIAGKQSTQEEFFHTFNALIEQGKTIVLTGDCSPADMNDLEDRVQSRLQSGLVADVHPADYELRLGVLQHKVEAYRKAHPDLTIEDGVLEFLAERISTSIRVLEGAMTRLFAFSSLMGGHIDLGTAKGCLADLLRASERKLTIEEIMKKVCDHYSVRMSDLVSPRRSRAIARPRQMAMYLAKKLTSRSYPEIGRKFGNRDHTTILHGVRKIEELMSIDSQVAEDALLLQRKLEG